MKEQPERNSVFAPPRKCCFVRRNGVHMQGLVMDDELTLTYPTAWAEEYRRNLTVACWATDFPDQFGGANELRSTRPGTLDLFPQHALMYLMRRDHGMQSITWFYLAAIDRRPQSLEEPFRPNPRSKHCAKIAGYWDTMREHIGADRFLALQRAVVSAGFRQFGGEPDLFCYDATGRWFFAEAKGNDQLLDSERRWFECSVATLGEAGRVHVYRLKPTRESMNVGP